MYKVLNALCPFCIWQCLSTPNTSTASTSSSREEVGSPQLVKSRRMSTMTLFYLSDLSPIKTLQVKALVCDRAVVEERRVKSCHRWVTVTGPGAGKRTERGQFGHAVLENELHARARALECT